MLSEDVQKQALCPTGRNVKRCNCYGKQYGSSSKSYKLGLAYDPAILFLGTYPKVPVNPKGNQPWVFIGRTDAEAEAPILWPYDAKNLLIRNDTDAGKD